MPRTFIIGSRASKLAQVQTRSIQAALSAAHPTESFDVAFMLTGGDKNKTDALYVLGGAGKALWTEELEVALLQDKTIDFIVHSLKDMPTVMPEGAELGAVIERHDPLDSLCIQKGLDYKTLEDLPDGSVVGTSSVRRVAQLKRAFPNLIFSDMRGNIDTRLAKLDDPNSIYTAAILAHAGLERMNLEHRVASDIQPPHLYHAVGQGALGIEIRSDDAEARRLLSVLSHLPTEMRCRAERSCLHVLEGGCSVPVGVQTIYTDASSSTSDSTTHAPFDSTTSSPSGSPPSNLTPESTLTLIGTVTSLNGDAQVLFQATAPMTCLEDASKLGETVAQGLIEHGAKPILDEVNRERAIRDAALKAKKAAAAAKGEAVAAGNEKADSWLAKKSSGKASDLPTNAEVDTAIASATASTSTSKPTVSHPSLPLNHPPIHLPQSPKTSKHQVLVPVHIPATTSIVHETAPILHLPASHPPILVTPSDDVSEVPTHCLRPPTPPPAEVTEEMCTRPKTPEMLDNILKRKVDDKEDGLVIEEGSGSSARKRRAVSVNAREMMQG